jgi:anti-sigma factor RsiW
MTEGRDCQADAAAYVLGALEEPEAEAFRRHMAECVICHDEVAAFGELRGALATAVPQLPPPGGLRRRVMGAVYAEATERRTVARSRGIGRAAAAFPRPAIAGALAVAICGAVIGGVELSSGGAGAVRVVQARVIGTPGTAELRVADGHAELSVQHLSAPRPGRIYELWLQRPGRPPAPTSALFSVTRAGAAAVGVPGGVDGVREVMVTQEPEGGSQVPTSRPVIIAQLS